MGVCYGRRVLVPAQQFGTCKGPITKARPFFSWSNEPKIHDVDWFLELRYLADGYRRDTQWNHIVILEYPKQIYYLTYIPESSYHIVSSVAGLIRELEQSYQNGLRDPKLVKDADDWLYQINNSICRYTPKEFVSEFEKELKQDSIYDKLFSYNCLADIKTRIRNFAFQAFNYDEETANLFIDRLTAKYNLFEIGDYYEEVL